jgi:hypothetical protein
MTTATRNFSAGAGVACAPQALNTTERTTNRVKIHANFFIFCSLRDRDGYDSSNGTYGSVSM